MVKWVSRRAPWFIKWSLNTSSTRGLQMTKYPILIKTFINIFNLYVAKKKKETSSDWEQIFTLVGLTKVLSDGWFGGWSFKDMFLIK